VKTWSGGFWKNGQKKKIKKTGMWGASGIVGMKGDKKYKVKTQKTVGRGDANKKRGRNLGK